MGHIDLKLLAFMNSVARRSMEPRQRPLVFFIMPPPDFEAGPVPMDDVTKEVSYFNLYPYDVRSFVEAPPGPCSIIHLRSLGLPSCGMAKCFADVVVDVDAFPEQ